MRSIRHSPRVARARIVSRPTSTRALPVMPERRLGPGLATQPTTFARADAPPAFLATGDKDTTVYPRNTRKLAAVLREKGAKVEERHYPGVDHAGTVLALSRPFRRKATLLADMTAFLRAAVG